jgi:L-arabinose isomerase
MVDYYIFGSASANTVERQTYNFSKGNRFVLGSSRRLLVCCTVSMRNTPPSCLPHLENCGMEQKMCINILRG